MSIRILQGDCRTVLPTLPEKSVQCVVSSPPYFGLRDYGTATWDGGDPACDHAPQLGKAFTSGTRRNGKNYSSSQKVLSRDCKCGATRVDAQIGLEASPAEYIAEMVAVFRLVWRVLRDDGTCWANFGDSYVSSATGNIGKSLFINGRGSLDAAAARPDKSHCGKPKDLLMMPARVAIALQADGWFLRSDIIWHKPNPMPESVTDRPTMAHEHVFLLSKRAKYFYDADAVREEAEYGRREWTNGRKAWDTLGHEHSKITGTTKGIDASAGRNLRNVWTIATAPFAEAHFATFPLELAERCIKAGTSEKGCCPACGAPWARVVERGDLVPTRKHYDKIAYGVVRDKSDGNDQGSNRARDGHRAGMAYECTATGWRPTCSCPPADHVPCTVLDPFSGAGTTALVADRLGRNAIGIELSPQYSAMARDRITDDAPLFADVS